jgi:hypothetical protein
VSFEISGQKVRGWVWRSPFRQGDYVEVVGKPNGDLIELFAIARPSDRVIALYPHCSRGRVAHIKNAAKWWAIGSCGFLGAVFLSEWSMASSSARFFTKEQLAPVAIIYPCVAAFFALMTASMTNKWMPFARLAEDAFHTLGWTNPSSVDLVKSSKAQRKPSDPGEFGTFYFRY